MTNRKDPHAGHRQRIKEKFNSEPDSLSLEELLELLLFFCIPYKDTSGIAADLLSRFHSLSGVLEAEREELSQVCGIGDNTTALIKLIPELCRRYINEKTNIEGERYDNIETLGRYLIGRYALEKEERVLLLLLDNSYRLISEELVCEGSVNSARISGKALLDIAKQKNASAVVLAHNHPKGIALPSTDDIETTNALCALFEAYGIPMLEHILVAGDEYTPIMYSKIGKKRTAPKTFYGEV